MRDIRNAERITVELALKTSDSCLPFNIGLCIQVVFSRKGFDSQYGSIASPILPNGRLLPLPIPSRHDDATLADLSYADGETARLITDLSGGKHSLATRVHLDPDLDCVKAARMPGWRPSLGQSGAAQSHLSRRGIGQGDVFLFFGWFRQAERVAGRWRYAPDAPNLHVLFGWLEVAEVLSIVTQREEALVRHPWAASHPHVAKPEWYNDERNTLYIAKTRSNYAAGNVAGGGRFPAMRPTLQLTKSGHSRSVWSLPSWFSPEGRTPLSYHPKATNWKDEDGSVTLRSAAKGQEFVIDGDAYPQLESWAGNLIRESA